MKNAAVLWTGGKDSTLALLAAREHLRVTRLVTFVPDPPRPFLAHPVAIMEAQAEALGIPHQCAALRPPLAGAYEDAIDALADDGVEVLVTGEMDRVAGHDNWIVERARDRVEVVRPLWNADRLAVLGRLLGQRMQVICTLARRAAFPRSAFSHPVVGRTFDADFVAELSRRHGVDGFDACGENGEYHTCVLDAPGFEGPLRLEGTRIESTDEFDHLRFDDVRLTSRS